jgi:hypothetical protein
VRVVLPALLPPMPYNHDELRKEIDNYNDTVWATVAFVNVCQWDAAKKGLDEKVRFGLGRPMNKTDSTVVTPDAVIQRRPSQGTVAEVKHTFPPSNSGDRRKEIFQQLKNYDDELTGWWTQSKKIKAHDIVLLTHITHVVEAADYLKTELPAAHIEPFKRHLAIIGYFRHEQAELYVTLKKEHGSLLDSELAERLRLSIPIAARHIELSRQVRFCDSRPPIPYILWLLWSYVFPERAETIPRDKNKGYTPIAVTVEDLTADLQKFYGFEPDGTGNKGTPRSDWIEAALDAFVSFRMAARGIDQSYIVRYKPIRGDTLERLGQLHYDLEQKNTNKQQKKPQLELFSKKPS